MPTQFVPSVRANGLLRRVVRDSRAMSGFRRGLATITGRLTLVYPMTSMVRPIMATIGGRARLRRLNPIIGIRSHFISRGRLTGHSCFCFKRGFVMADMPIRLSEVRGYPRRRSVWRTRAREQGWHHWSTGSLGPVGGPLPQMREKRLKHLFVNKPIFRVNQTARRAICLPSLTARVDHRVRRDLDVVVAGFLVKAEAVHGVERPSQRAVFIFTEPCIHSPLRVRVVMNVGIKRQCFVLAGEEPRGRPLQPNVEIVRREALPRQRVVKRAPELPEFGRRHTEGRLTVGPSSYLLRGDTQKLAVSGLNAVAGVIGRQQRSCMVPSRPIPRRRSMLIGCGCIH